MIEVQVQSCQKSIQLIDSPFGSYSPKHHKSNKSLHERDIVRTKRVPYTSPSEHFLHIGMQNILVFFKLSHFCTSGIRSKKLLKPCGVLNWTSQFMHLQLILSVSKCYSLTPMKFMVYLVKCKNTSFAVGYLVRICK